MLRGYTRERFGAGGGRRHRKQGEIQAGRREEWVQRAGKGGGFASFFLFPIPESVETALATEKGTMSGKVVFADLVRRERGACSADALGDDERGGSGSGGPLQGKSLAYLRAEKEVDSKCQRLELLMRRARAASARNEAKRAEDDRRTLAHVDGVQAARAARRAAKHSRYASAEERARDRWDDRYAARGREELALEARRGASVQRKAARIAQVAETARMLNRTKRAAITEFKGAFRGQATEAYRCMVDRLDARPPDPSAMLLLTASSRKSPAGAGTPHHVFDVCAAVACFLGSVRVFVLSQHHLSPAEHRQHHASCCGAQKSISHGSVVRWARPSQQGGHQCGWRVGAMAGPASLRSVSGEGRARVACSEVGRRRSQVRAFSPRPRVLRLLSSRGQEFVWGAVLPVWQSFFSEKEAIRGGRLLVGEYSRIRCLLSFLYGFLLSLVSEFRRLLLHIFLSYSLQSTPSYTTPTVPQHRSRPHHAASRTAQLTTCAGFHTTVFFCFS